MTKRKTQKQPKVQPRLGQAKTLKAVASRTGLPPHVIKAAKAAGSKAFRKNGNVDCDELKKDVAKLPVDSDSGSEPNLFLEQARGAQVKRKLDEQKLLEKQKLVWPIEKIQRAWTRYVMTMKSKLAISENAVSVEAGMKLGLTNEQVNAIKEIHIKHNRAALKEMFLAEWGTVNCPDCGKVFQS